MTANRFKILILIFWFFTGIAGAQQYELDLDKSRNVQPKRSDAYTLDWKSLDKRVDARAEVPEPVVVAAQPIIEFRPPAPQASNPQPRQVWNKPQPQRVMNVEFNANQYYDHYKQRYLIVRAVEVATTRDGYTRYETYENIGQCRSYPVYLRELKEGDSYEVRVIWNDGSNRTVSDTIDNYSYGTVVVDTPDFMAYSAW